MHQEAINDYKDKLKRFLATPHSAKAYYEDYKKDQQEASFDDYTKKLEDLLDQLDEGKLEEQADLCQQIKQLRLPHNQFGCSD